MIQRYTKITVPNWNVADLKVSNFVTTVNTIGMITCDWFKTAIGAAREFKLDGYIAEGAFKNDEYCGFAREIQRREDDQGYKIEYYLTSV